MSPAGGLRHEGEPPPISSAPAPPPGQRKHPVWRWVRRVLTLAFFATVAFFMVRYARTIDWAQVWASIRATPRHVLLTALGLAAATHLVYSTMDLLGRSYTGHHLPPRKAMQVSFVSYAFNLNFGSVIGAVAFRLRLYSRMGLDNAEIVRVISLSMLSNWLGYLVLAGFAFTIAPLELPPGWRLGGHGLRWLGVALLGVAALYVALCTWSGKREFTLRGHSILLPPPRMVVMQLIIACAHWVLMAAIIWTLLQGALPYPDVLSVLLVGAVAGVVTHVPAGLGVLEAVFLALLSHRLPEYQLLAALLTYRAVYYLAPMVVAVGMYVYVELRAKRTRRRYPKPAERT